VSPTRSPALEAVHVTKSFPGTRALDDVAIRVEPGEIVALVGGNGSGKSTLIKILSGVYGADDGTLTMAGSNFDLRSFGPGDARACGIHVVHQEPTTFRSMTVAENLSIGRGFETQFGGRIDRRRVNARAMGVLRRCRIDAVPDTVLGDLRQSEQAMVAIARALQDEGDGRYGILILDEATAPLPPAEVEDLFAALRTYAADGQAIMLVTHRLDEARSIADRIVVLRDGRCIEDSVSPDVSHDRLVELIAGRSVQALTPVDAATADQPPLVAMKGVTGGVLQGVDISIDPGQIVGLAGIAGAGCSTVLRMLFGVQPIESGELRLRGRPARLDSPREAMSEGIAYVPPDRAGMALFSEHSVRENLTIASLTDGGRRFALRHKLERAAVASDRDRFRIVSASAEMPVSQLSGGNQQKVVLARWLRRNPDLLLLDEPTQGVDVGARADLWTLVRGLVEAGGSAIVASSDIDELVGVCNRIIVLGGGRVVAELDGALDANRVIELQHSLKGAP
jgi:ribose transport system ATP-binding protein